MATYDFTTRPDRQNTGALKYYFSPKALLSAGAVPLTVADMELFVAPEIVEAMVQAAQHGVVGYTFADGPYTEAVCRWYQTRFGADILPQHIVCTPGIISALNVAVRTFTSPGEKVLIQPPVYHPFFDAVKNNGRTLLENSLVNENGRYRINFEEFEAMAADPACKLFLLCSPHNPVGRVWTKDELLQMARICKQHGVVVVADEIHGDLVHAPHQQILFSTLGEDARENCVICTAVSKTFNLAGLSCSNILIPNDALRDAYRQQVSAEGFHCPPYFAYNATIAAYDKGGPWLEELLAHIRRNADDAVAYLAEHLPAATVSPLEGTYLLWIDLRFLGLSGKEMTAFLEENARVILNKGGGFGQEGEGFVRINLAAPAADIQTAVRQLCAAATAR